MLPKTVWTIAVAIVLLSETAPASDVVDLASSFIGRPYVWGAEGPNAFDCSGLTQYVFREFAVDLPRRAISQSRVGDPAGTRIRRGDLLFFANDARRSLVTHVGIYEGGRQMIEASKRSGQVRRSNLDDAYWAERFMFARRVIGDISQPEVAGDEPGQSDDKVSIPSRRKRDVRKAAARALEEFAGILLRRPRR
jgi:hypothetical protein